ncbi:aspartic peptidase domain-containing protein [Pisolithus thermaeus]|nr:aspartic peptidase domain-containing protein [Pisolithus croceorrhizus]KAI6160762.1 aspartic peptidase domain-containing protein [Pisolithus thermaeus]
MHSRSVFLATVLLALTSPTKPIEIRANSVTLPLAKKLHTSGGAQYLVDQDRARVRTLIKRGLNIASQQNRRGGAVPLGESQAVVYIAQVNFGSSTTEYNLIVDTGSSNTWVGAGQPWTPDSSTTSDNEAVSVSYGSGQMEGTLYTGPVSLGSCITVEEQGFVLAEFVQGFQGYNGVLGIGPENLTLGTILENPTRTIPTITQNLYQFGVIGQALVGLFFEPSSTNTAEGELSFGAPNPARYIGELTYYPVTGTSPASRYWGINQSITYGSTVILSYTAGIVDTGTTLIHLASNAFLEYQAATGAQQDLPAPAGTGLLYLTTEQYSQLQNLDFHISGDTYTLIPNAQIWPRALNAAIGGTSDRVYLIFSNLDTPSGEGLDFVNGMCFLERYYSVYDSDQNRVGFASTEYSSSIVN